MWILSGCQILGMSTSNEDIPSPIMEPTSTHAFKITTTPSTTPMPTNPTPPDFILMFLPDKSINFEAYSTSLENKSILGRGIMITMILDREDWDTKKSLSLYIDGERISNDTIVIGDGLVENGPFYLSWAPELHPGLHEVHFEVVTKSGDVLEYSWHFVITDP